MKRVALAHGLFLGLSLLGGCHPSFTISCTLPVQRGPAGRVVVFWLKQPGDVAARECIIDASHSFGDIPGVERVEAGEMLPSPPPNVDDSYDVAVVIRFRDVQALFNYNSHPEHLTMLNELMPLVERVVIYDFLIDPAAAQK